MKTARGIFWYFWWNHLDRTYIVPWLSCPLAYGTQNNRKALRVFSILQCWTWLCFRSEGEDFWGSKQCERWFRMRPCMKVILQGLLPLHHAKANAMAKKCSHLIQTASVHLSLLSKFWVRVFVQGYRSDEPQTMKGRVKGCHIPWYGQDRSLLWRKDPALAVVQDLHTFWSQRRELQLGPQERKLEATNVRKLLL